jgi:hypothetical protein
MDFPASLIALVQEQVARSGRLGATGITRIPDLAAAVPVAVAGVPGEAAAPPLTFLEAGYAIALYGQERTGTTAKFASTEVRLQINGTRDVITSGELGGAFFPMLGLFGPNVNWFPLTIRVEKRDVWQVTYRNFDAAAVANPVVGMSFISDLRMAQMAHQLSAAGR